jgi:hypothetical protein
MKCSKCWLQDECFDIVHQLHPNMGKKRDVPCRAMKVIMKLANNIECLVMEIGAGGPDQKLDCPPPVRNHNKKCNKIPSKSICSECWARWATGYKFPNKRK